MMKRKLTVAYAMDLAIRKHRHRPDKLLPRHDAIVKQLAAHLPNKP